MKIKKVISLIIVWMCIFTIFGVMGAPDTFKREYRVINRDALLAQNLNQTLRDTKYQLIDDIGMKLNLVRPDSILEQAGVVSGDVLLTINDVPIDDLINDHVQLDMLSIGDIYIVVVRREDPTTSTDEIVELMIEAPYT